MDLQHTDTLHRTQSRRSNRKGQGLTEFALILPLLLTLIFGIIEFARLFQAYLVVVNAARFGVRYAVTGNYEYVYCSDMDADGSDCDGDSKKDEEDQARLLSIYDVVDGSAVAIMRDNTAAVDQPGYFDVSVCSFAGAAPAYNWDANTNTCHPHDYAGDPEEGTTRVLVGITYQHPLILPIISSWWPSLHLHAERTGILEQFRVARVLGLPPQINVPTPTPMPPTKTPTPTEIPPTPTHTHTPTPTDTPTSTPTFTASPTPLPKCEDMQFGTLSLHNYDLMVPVSNNGPHPAKIMSVTTTWNGQWHDQVSSVPTDMAFTGYSAGGALLADRPNVLLNPGFSVSESGLDANLPAGQNLDFGVRFTKKFNGYYPAYYYYHAADFDVAVEYTILDKECSVSTTGRFGPVVEPLLPDSPIRGPFDIGANAYDPDEGGNIKQVLFEIRNSAGDPVFSKTESSAPYCMTGESGGTCANIDPYGNWPGTNNPILSGSYTLYIQAMDFDGPANYEHRTRILTPFTLALPTPTPSATPCATNGTGLRGDYYTWEEPPSNKPAFGTDIDNYVRSRGPELVNFDWGNGSPIAGVPNDHFAVRWTGQIMPMYSERYTFYTKSDDGSRIFVNGQQVASYWSNHSASTCPGASSSDCKSQKINLQACQKYDITVEYYENTGGASMQILWRSASQGNQVIPQVNLYPGNGPIPPTSTPSKTPTITRTPTRTQVPTITRTPTKTLVPTITRTPTKTETPKPTLTPSKTATFTPRPPKPSDTRTPTPVPPATKTPKPTSTRTPTPTKTPDEAHPTITPTRTPTPTRRPPPTAG